MYSTALHILVMSVPMDILMTRIMFCIYSSSEMFDTLIISFLYSIKHEAMTLLKLLYNIGLLCENTEISHSQLDWIYKIYIAHNTEQKGIHNHGVSTCTIHSASQMLSQLFLRLMFNIIPEFGGKSSWLSIGLLLPSPCSTAVWATHQYSNTARAKNSV